MTPSSRPNLGGLFTGSTPPERSSAVAAPRGSGSAREPGATVPPLGAPVGQSSVAVALEFIDPLRAVERYFAFLQVVLDVNHRVAIAVTSAAVSLPRRVGIWR